MKIYKLVLLIILNKISFCQIPYNFSGVLILENDQEISYSLNLIEKDGKISGFSLTNIGLEDETKTEINGLYFKYENEFQLNEKNNIYTNSNKEPEKFCFISMNLKFSSSKKKFLEGTFEGYFRNGKKCSRGHVLLIEEKKIKKISKKIENNTNNRLKVKNIVTTKNIQTQDTIKIEWDSDSIKINIWDSNKEDGDKINLKLNDKTILNNFVTKKNKKTINLKLKKGKNFLNLVAINEGLSPPNTSKIELIDKKITYPIITKLKKNENLTFELIKSIY